MKRFTLLALVIGGITLTAAPAFATHSWNGYHWARTSNPFTIKVGDNVGSAWDSYLNTALTDWSKDTAGNPLNATRVDGTTDARKCRPRSGTVQVCDARYGGQWLGLAQIWLSGSHITQAITKMNDAYYYQGSYYDTPAWRGAVMCQEIGHAWGLDHQSEDPNVDKQTCMDYYRYPDADNTHPNSHDYEELALIYAHTNDGGTTIASLATGNASPVRVERNDRITSSTITEHFADGSRRITHVRWAIG